MTASAFYTLLQVVAGSVNFARDFEALTASERAAVESLHEVVEGITLLGPVDSGFSSPPASPPEASERPSTSSCKSEISIERLLSILEERGKTYGPADRSFAVLGAGWGALLRVNGVDIETIPPHVVAAMMCFLKLTRISADREFKQDNYDDAINYILLAHKVDPR